MADLNFTKVSDENLRRHYKRQLEVFTVTMEQEMRRQYVLQTLMEEAQRRGIEEQL